MHTWGCGKGWGDVRGGTRGLTDLVTIVGVLDVVWEWWQWVQVILPLSQQACCGEAKREGVPSRAGRRVPEALLGGEIEVRQACKTLRAYKLTFRPTGSKLFLQP